jgi:hypothetical protein
MAETTYGLAAALVRLDPALYIRLQDADELPDHLAAFDSLDDMAGALEANPLDLLEEVLEQDFHEAWLQFHQCGIIRYELLNICAACEAVLADFGWPEADDSRLLRYAVITAISDYLAEGGGDGL